MPRPSVRRKDPWRLDRAAALRARQIALAIVDTGFVRDALVTFAWAPRDRRPSHVEIVVDGRTLSAADVGRWLGRYDPSLAATWEELGLAGVNWENCARFGHFGGGAPWEPLTPVLDSPPGHHARHERLPIAFLQGRRSAHRS
jgi:S-adenosylmethionine synthetase